MTFVRTLKSYVMAKKKYMILATIISASCLAQEEEPKDEIHESCIPHISPIQKSIPAELNRLLGEWKDCKVKYYEETEFGLDALIVASWPNVTLSMKYQPPEAASFMVEISGESLLTSAWYEENRTNLLADFFDINWNRDEFPGPTSEYYVSPEVGANGQFWVERDKNGNVTWMRFSYAL